MMKVHRHFVLLTVVAACLPLLCCAPGKPSSAELNAYVKARDLYMRGSVDQAAAVVAHIDSRTRGFHQARLLEGKILFFRGSMGEAERVFLELTHRRAGYTEAQIWLSRALQAQGKAAEAEKILDAALEVNPGDARLLHQAGLLSLGRNDISSALGFFRRAQDSAIELAQSYIESARILYRFGLLDPAVADLATALALLPADSDMRKPVMELERRIRETKK
jgi:Flp pilus assembly protein TadD